MPARLAPTPSGYLHRGNAANFCVNALLARETDGRLLLRIDDLDQARFRPEYLEDIFRVIEWLGIKVTDGPAGPEDFAKNWSQEHRMGNYREALEKIREKEFVFACPCSRRELAGGEHAYGCREGRIDLDTPGVAWRINTGSFFPAYVSDRVTGGFSIDLDTEMRDFVIRKKDGRPSYQLACVVDDLHFGITDAGRGQDLLASTAAQVMLSDFLEYPPLLERIRFVHHPLLLTTGGEKLSKSAGAEGVASLGGGAEELFAVAAGWLGG